MFVAAIDWTFVLLNETLCDRKVDLWKLIDILPTTKNSKNSPAGMPKFVPSMFAWIHVYLTGQHQASYLKQ